MMFSSQHDLQSFRWSLPKDITLIIFAFLDPKTLFRVKIVCRDWKKTIDNAETIWNKIVHELTSSYEKIEEDFIHKNRTGFVSSQWINRFETTAGKNGVGFYECNKEGLVYKGEWKNGEYYGKGLLKKETLIYFGNFEQGECHGQGSIIMFEPGKLGHPEYTHFYTGLYFYGQRQFGTYTYPDGDYYEGGFLDGARHGLGVYYDSDGDIYKGNHKNGQSQGEGRLILSCGDIYTGSFDDNCRTGEGVYIFANGVKYEGYFEDNEFSGQGKITWKDGDWYEGKWSEGRRNGRGVFHHFSKDGKRKEEFQEWSGQLEDFTGIGPTKHPQNKKQKI